MQNNRTNVLYFFFFLKVENNGLVALQMFYLLPNLTTFNSRRPRTSKYFTEYRVGAHNLKLEFVWRQIAHNAKILSRCICSSFDLCLVR